MSISTLDQPVANPVPFDADLPWMALGDYLLLSRKLRDLQPISAAMPHEQSADEKSISLQ